MNVRSAGIWRVLAIGLAVVLLSSTEADARGSRRGRSGGHAARAPRASAARHSRAYKPPRLPRASAPARSHASRAVQAQNHAKSVQTHANKALVGTNTGNPTRAANSRSLTNRAASVAGSTSIRQNVATTTGNRAAALNTTTTGVVGTTGSATTTPSYTYGTGSSARRYRAYGYGSGYRNRSSGRRNGYGRSQGTNRAVVARLRSVHSALAQVDHDYQGHRVRAMHSISMAVRQLSHRSMVYGGVGFQSGLNNNNMAMGRRRNNGANGIGGRGNRRQPMTQAQSDARMSQALRSLQGIQMQLSNQGSSTTSHSRAGGHVQRAVQELNIALKVR